MDPIGKKTIGPRKHVTMEVLIVIISALHTRETSFCDI